MQILPTASSSAASLLADISAVVQPTATGLYGVLLVVVGIPLAIWLIKVVIGMFPKAHARRN